MMAAVALMGVFDARRLRHWFVLGLLLVTMFVTGLMWLSIRAGYRQEFEDEVFAESAGGPGRTVVGPLLHVGQE